MCLAFFWLMRWLALPGLSSSLLSLLVSCLLVTVGDVVIVVGILGVGDVGIAICIGSALVVLVAVAVVLHVVVVYC